jgi:rubrerythrin
MLLREVEHDIRDSLKKGWMCPKCESMISPEHACCPNCDKIKEENKKDDRVVLID